MKKTLTTVVICLFLTTFIACTNSPKASEYKADNGKTYKYKLELTGIPPNGEVKIKFTVLTNDAKLTFDEVSKSLLSSHYGGELDFYILSTKD